jgi:hypothetical protein
MPGAHTVARPVARTVKYLGGAAVIIAVAVGGIAAGRHTASPHDRGFAQGDAAGYAEGLAAGRTLQIGDSVPKNAQSVATSAFQEGYRAGEADVFGNFDGGWKLDAPYLVTLTQGVGGAPYRISDRQQLVPGQRYRLCAGGRATCTAP